uniref:Uncharacterized protein n=1 Tax=Setaria digitata TaxID=48799 RepID=A0A915Q541_9BILA
MYTMNGTLTVILSLVLCVIVHCSNPNAIIYERLCHQYPTLLRCQSEAQSEKRTRNYDFIRFGRSGRVNFSPSTYDYIRFGKRFSGFRANRNFEFANLEQ